MKKVTKVLKIVNQLESERKAWFSRANNNMYIYFSGSDMWPNSRYAQDLLGVYGRDVAIDRLSGQLVMKLENVYGGIK